MIKNSDIRIVDTNLDVVTNQLEQYLDSIDLIITKKEIKPSTHRIIAENKQKSFLKLFWKPKPQITCWHLAEHLASGVKIEVKVSSLGWFKSCFYGLFIFLVIFSGILLKTAFSINENPFYFFKMFSLSMALLFSSAYILNRLIDTNPYKKFIDGYYKLLRETTLKKEKVIQSDPCIPEMIPGIFILLALVIIPFSDIQLSEITETVVLWSIAFISIPVILFIVLLYYPWKAVKAKFLLIALYLCLPLAIYSNMPLIGLSSEQGAGNVAKLIKNANLIKNKFRGNPQSVKREIIKTKETKNYIYKISVALFLGNIFLLIPLLVLLAAIFYLPIEILRSIEHFNTSSQESLYFQAMEPDKIINPFNCCVIGIWLLLGIANLSGLYLSLAILGKTFGLHNFVIKSGISDLFFESSRMMFSYLLPGGGWITNTMHTFAMLAYAMPMPILYILVVVKNIKSTLKTALFLQDKSHDEVFVDITAKVEAICRECKIASPITKVIASARINEGASYLGFPVFRNLLIIRKQTVEILKKTDYTLDAYLAHEIYHLKEHTFIWKILCLLSDFTLLGNGFLTILYSSYDFELKADAFAAEWLKQHGMPPKSIISALQAQEELKEQELFGMLLSNLNFAKSVENEEYRQTIIEQCENSGRLKKALINLKLLYQIYFGEYITSYIHPSNKYRIDQIEENISEAV